MYTNRYIVTFYIDGIAAHNVKVRLPLYETDGLEFDEVFDKIVDEGIKELYKQESIFIPDWAVPELRKEED